MSLFLSAVKEANFKEEVLAFAKNFTDKKADRLQVLKQLTQAAVGGVQTSLLSMENSTLNVFYSSPEGQEKIKEFYLIALLSSVFKSKLAVSRGKKLYNNITINISVNPPIRKSVKCCNISINPAYAIKIYMIHFAFG